MPSLQCQPSNRRRRSGLSTQPRSQSHVHRYPQVAPISSGFTRLWLMNATSISSAKILICNVPIQQEMRGFQRHMILIHAHAYMPPQPPSCQPPAPSSSSVQEPLNKHTHTRARTVHQMSQARWPWAHRHTRIHTNATMSRHSWARWCTTPILGTTTNKQQRQSRVLLLLLRHCCDAKGEGLQANTFLQYIGLRRPTRA